LPGSIELAYFVTAQVTEGAFSFMILIDLPKLVAVNSVKLLL